MRTIIIIIVMIFLTSFNSCQKEQIVSQNDEERILKIKHRIYFGECLGYCDTQLIIDSTNIIYIQKGWDEKGDLPEKDTAFTISQSQWEIIKKSLSLNNFFSLDSAYVEKHYLDDGLVTIEVLTNKRYKKINHDFSKYLQVLDSLYNLLNDYRRYL